MKKMSSALIVLLLLALSMLSSNIGFSENELQDGITWFFSTYQYDLPESMIEQIDAAFTPIMFSCGDVSVKLENILYDGVWMYTSAVIAPTDSGKTLVMPDDAEPGYPIAGTYGENLRSDSRTFAEAAAEDKKQLVRVMAVPDEFFEVSYFICASRQDANDTSTMVCCALCNWQDDEINISFSITVTGLDSISNEPVSTETYSYPITVKRLGNLETKKYRPVDAEQSLECETITLTKTALTCYAVAEKAGNQVYIPLQVCDVDGVPFSSGVPADAMTTLNLDSLPDHISVRTEQNQLILFTAIDEEP